MTICNVVGQVVKEEEIKNSSRYEADLTNMPEGNYILSVKGADGSVSTHKILLSK
jgi:hypothetical protein